MPLTYSRVRQQDMGDGEQIVSDVTFDSSYPAGPNGGEPITAAALGFRVGSRLDSVQVDPVGSRKVRYVPNANGRAGVLKVFDEPADDWTLNRPGVAIGGTKSQVQIANPITKVVGGVVAEVAAGAVAFTATTHDITADAALIQEAIYLLSVQAGGTLILTKGTTAGEDAAVAPALPAGEAPVGYVKIQVAAGVTDFDATTDDLDAAHLTTTFYDWDGEAAQAQDLSGLTARVTATGR